MGGLQHLADSGVDVEGCGCCGVASSTTRSGAYDRDFSALSCRVGDRGVDIIGAPKPQDGEQEEHNKWQDYRELSDFRTVIRPQCFQPSCHVPPLLHSPDPPHLT